MLFVSDVGMNCHANPSVQQRLRAEVSNFRSARGNPVALEDLISPTAFPYPECGSSRTKAVLREMVMSKT